MEASVVVMLRRSGQLTILVVEALDSFKTTWSLSYWSFWPPLPGVLVVTQQNDICLLVVSTLEVWAFLFDALFLPL